MKFEMENEMTFDEWWKQTKPAECDELKQDFEECWENSAVWCADVCDEQSKRLQPPGNGKMYKAAQSCRREIFKRLDAWIGVRSNVELRRGGAFPPSRWSAGLERILGEENGK